MSFRMLAAGAGMFAALTFAATSIAPAEPGGAKPSATTQPRAAKAPHRAARPHREAKGRHGKRTRNARQHHRQPTERTAQRARRPFASAPMETPPPVRQETSADRRFREFLNPQSFTAVVNEPLRNPRLLAASFSGDIVNPELEFINATTPVESAPRAETPTIVARDQTTGNDSESKAAPIARSDPAPIARASQIEKEPDGMSYLGWIFIAWGGVLTLASAVRMAVS
jgi:hypothetical protein